MHSLYLSIHLHLSIYLSPFLYNETVSWKDFKHSQKQNIDLQNLNFQPNRTHSLYLSFCLYFILSVATAFGLKKWTKMDPKRLFFNSKSWNSKCDAILSSNNWILNRKYWFWFFSRSPRGANDPRAVHDCSWAKKMNKNGPQTFIFHFKKLKFKMWSQFII